MTMEFRGQIKGLNTSVNGVKAVRRNKFFLDSYGRYTPKLDPEILNAATQVERNRIAALIELQEGPGRFLA